MSIDLNPTEAYNTYLQTEKIFTFFAKIRQIRRSFSVKKRMSTIWQDPEFLAVNFATLLTAGMIGWMIYAYLDR